MALRPCTSSGDLSDRIGVAPHGLCGASWCAFADQDRFFVPAFRHELAHAAELDSASSSTGGAEGRLDECPFAGSAPGPHRTAQIASIAYTASLNHAIL